MSYIHERYNHFWARKQAVTARNLTRVTIQCRYEHIRDSWLSLEPSACNGMITGPNKQIITQQDNYHGTAYMT